ncbi:MAG: amidophosphoribosyltransferase, partial [Planctomycetota bacterium]
MSGIFGVASHSNCMDDLFYGTDYQCHLGTEFGGLAIQGNRLHRSIKNLFDDFYHTHSGEMGIGVISDSDPQPVMVDSKFGTYAVVTAGLITNRDHLGRELIEQGITFSESTEGELNHTELVAKMIAQGDSIVGGIQKVFDRVEGSVSLLLMTREGIYAGSDGHARLPLAVAERDGTVAVASESCAFPNLGMKATKYLQSGEIVFVDSSGLKATKKLRGKRKICTFLWIYTGYPASSYEGISVESVREHCGQALARKDTVEAD